MSRPSRQSEFVLAAENNDLDAVKSFFEGPGAADVMIDNTNSVCA